MFDFIGDLPAIQQTLWYIAIPCTIIFILFLISTLVGLGGEGADLDADTDLDIDGDHDFDFWGMISVKNLFNFLTFFSWTGLTAFEWNFPTFIAIPFAIVFAIAFTFLLNMIFMVLLKFQEDKTTKITDTINKTGEVYLTVPKGGKRSGKVEVIVNGAKRIFNAVSADNTIRTGNKVLVLDVNEKNQLIVAKDV